MDLQIILGLIAMNIIITILLIFINDEIKGRK
jgi:hypothetical protein